MYVRKVLLYLVVLVHSSLGRDISISQTRKETTHRGNTFWGIDSESTEERTLVIILPFTQPYM